MAAVVSAEVHTRHSETTWEVHSEDLADLVVRLWEEAAGITSRIVNSPDVGETLSFEYPIPFFLAVQRAVFTEQVPPTARAEPWDHIRRLNRRLHETLSVRTRATGISSTTISSICSITLGGEGFSYRNSLTNTSIESKNSPHSGRSALGERLRQIRASYIASGGRLLSLEEVRQEVAKRRGEDFTDK